MIRAVSFDIGGTLIKPSKENSLIQQLSMLSTENIDTIKRAYTEHFLTRQISIEDFCKKAKLKCVTEVSKIVDQYYKSKPLAPVWEDAPQALKDIKKSGITLIALSNKSYKNPFCLNSYGLQQWFFKEIYSCDVGYAKPQLNIFRYAQEILQLNPEEIIHIGDSFYSDFIGAQKACWNSVLINRGGEQFFTRENVDALVINSLNDLLGYLDKQPL